MTPPVSRAAPAKVNLYLGVGAPRADGRHPLDSLVVFASVGDRVTLVAAAPRKGGAARSVWAIAGPFAQTLQADLGDQKSIMQTATEALLQFCGVGGDFVFRLEKNLPIASGIGGGSADAAAALILVRNIVAPGWNDEKLAAFAAAFGADLPACVLGRTALMRGTGEEMLPASAMPPLPAVLVNPGAPCPTGAVYRQFDAMGLGEGFAEIDPPDVTDANGWIVALAARGNDLTAPALRVQPAIGNVLAALEAQPQTRLARMSGSGATCFALTASIEDAEALARHLALTHADWWVKATTLAGEL